MAASVTLSVPGSASRAGCAPSMVWGSWVFSGGGANFFPRLVMALAMEEWSMGRLASWWNTLRLRMMVYTRLALPKEKGENMYQKMMFCE